MSDPATIEAAARALGPLAQHHAPLGARSTYRVGGAAALLVTLESDADVVRLAAAVRTTGIDVLVVGKGSNLLVADAGFAGLAVVLGEGFAATRSWVGLAAANSAGLALALALRPVVGAAIAVWVLDSAWRAARVAARNPAREVRPARRG